MTENNARWVQDFRLKAYASPAKLESIDGRLETWSVVTSRQWVPVEGAVSWPCPYLTCVFPPGARYHALLIPSCPGALADLASSGSLARILQHFRSESSG